LLTTPTTENLPPLTEEILRTNAFFKRFEADYKAKKIKTPIFVEYQVFIANEEFEEAKGFDENFLNGLINSEKAKCLSSSELQITKAITAKKQHEKNAQIAANIKSKKKPIPLSKLLGGAVGFLIFGGIIGFVIAQIIKVDSLPVDNSNVDNSPEIFVPIQPQYSITIDQSYRAVPMDDIVLSGEVADDGKSYVTLPAFSNLDFFNHVYGYTYGYSRDKNAERIEFYGGQQIEITTDMKLYRVLNIFGGGSGTQDDPYLISYFDQLSLLAEKPVKGFFKQVANIYFPTGNASINIFSDLKEKETAENYFEYDGGNFRIFNLSSPLFGTVSGASFKNINIRDSFITSEFADNYGLIAKQARQYRYTIDDTEYDTGEVKFTNCTVTHSSITLAPFVVTETSTTKAVAEETPVSEPPMTDENGNIVQNPYEPLPEPPKQKYAVFSAGGITGQGGIFENCYVADFGIYSTADDQYFLNAGGISGKPTNITNSGVFNVYISGNIFNAGGLIGSAEGTRIYNAAGEELPITVGGNVLGCFAKTVTIYAENSVGGLVGIGSTDSENAYIANSYTAETTLAAGLWNDDGIQTKQGFVGGIMGCDGTGKNGHIFTRMLSQDGYYALGENAKSTWDDTVLTAPLSAFYLDGMLESLNRGTVGVNEKEIFTGQFIFEINIAATTRKNGGMPFPQTISTFLPIETIKEK
jgi:hypothetical protein